MLFAGFDLETTGLDANINHRIIQIGVALEDGTGFNHDICPIGDINISSEALKVNGFSLERIARGLSPSEVEDLLVPELSKLGEITAVGWNVGSFDLAFIGRDLPRVKRCFSHRCVDLTGICILKGGNNWRTVKAEWQAKAEAALGEVGVWHDALWDAKAALKVWQLLQRGEIA